MGSHAGKDSRLAILNVVGLTERFLDDRMPRLRAFRESSGVHGTRVRPMLPAVTSSVQATYLTGQPPSHHGIVGNGWYDRERCEHLFWKQSDRLVRGPKLWETVRQTRPDFTCARLFWWNNMYSTVDYSLTPRPIYGADGSKVFDVTSRPLSIRDEIKAELGPFPFPSFWGPASGIASSRWIAESARWIEERYRPHLNLVYLPHLDYDLQRFGPRDPAIDRALGEIDAVAGDLIDQLTARGIDVAVLSEYGITSVNRPLSLNRLFREQGWLQIKDELGRDTLEAGDCRVLAIADHQIAHLYVQDPDPGFKREVESLVRQVPGVASVLGEEEQWEAGLDHPRSGDLVAVSEEDSWFTYYFWDDDARAPDYARTVDIHRKPGFDPAELFLDPERPFPKARVAGKLIRKKLGFRTLLDVIPLDPALVRGSHGALARDPRDWPLLLGPFKELDGVPDILAEDVFSHLRRFCEGTPSLRAC